MLITLDVFSVLEVVFGRNQHERVGETRERLCERESVKLFSLR